MYRKFNILRSNLFVLYRLMHYDAIILYFIYWIVKEFGRIVLNILVLLRNIWKQELKCQLEALES